MKDKPVPISTQRLRSIGEDRLIEKPLHVRRTIIRGPWRKRPGLLVWMAAIGAVVIFFSFG